MFPFDFDDIYESMNKCKQNVLWKESVSAFYLDGVTRCSSLSDAINKGTYTPKPPKKITVHTPKKREAISIAFSDRVYQRSLNDKVIYPIMTKSFIYDNCACQKGKGTMFAKDRLKRHMQKHFKKFGRDGWVLQCDVHHYYDNMRHDTTSQLFRDKLPGVYAEYACKILNEQYAGDVGFNPGSQIVQIAGISVPDEMDHMIKERLGVKLYIRYMDDFILIHNDREFLEHCKEEISKELAKVGLELHPKKTRIYKLDNGIDFLGFHFRLVDTGKVIVSLLGENVKREKRKLRRMAKLVKNGEMRKEKMMECYLSWKAHASYGNSYNLLKRMDKYVDGLLEVCV